MTDSDRIAELEKQLAETQERLAAAEAMIAIGRFRGLAEDGKFLALDVYDHECRGTIQYRGITTTVIRERDWHAAYRAAVEAGWLVEKKQEYNA